MKKFVCLFVSFILVLFFVRCPDVYAEEIIFCDVPESAYNDMSPDFINYIDNINVNDDMINFYNAWKGFSSYSDEVDLFAVFFTSNEIVTITHGYPDNFTYVDKDTSVYGSDYNNNILNYFCYGNTNVTRYTLDYKYIQGKIILNGRLISIDFNNNRFSWDNDSDYTGNFVSCYVYPFNYDSSALRFTVDSELTNDININNLGNTFEISAENTTDNYYDYMVYISDYPSSIGIINSFNSAAWFMSSKQWCYQWLNDYSALNGSISDYIADNIADGLKGSDILDYTFGNGMYNSLVNAWGGAFDGAKEYFSVDDETMSFYQVSQTNCPVYRINPNDTKTHTISYSSLNLELGKKYYLNIIYMPVDFKAYSAMTAPIVDAATNQGGNYPVFDTRLIPGYSVYDSYEFSVSDGVFSQDANTLYSYSDLIKYTNPSNSVAKIESDDDEIIVSDNDSYDNSVSTEYINYGQIYHGCTFYNGTSGDSGGSGGLVEENIELKIYGVDDLDFEITQLSEPVSKFKQFMQSVFGFLPEEMVGLFILGISTCIICRILGR